MSLQTVWKTQKGSDGTRAGEAVMTIHGTSHHEFQDLN